MKCVERKKNPLRLPEMFVKRFFACFSALPAPVKFDKAQFRESLLETLSDMFGPECISALVRDDIMSVTVDEKTAIINLNTMARDFLLGGSGTHLF